MESQLAALLFASAVIMGSPGPSTISVTAVGAAFGIRRSLNYAGGLIVGTIAVLLIVAAGVVVLVMSIPHGATVLTAAATVYICYLAIKIAMAPPIDAQNAQTTAPAFVGGLLLAIANPKAYFAIAAVFAGAQLNAVVKIVLLSAMIVLIHLTWLLAGASLSRLLHDPLSSRLINVTLAVALVAVTLHSTLR